jgi:hypothetical protein
MKITQNDTCSEMLMSFGIPCTSAKPYRFLKVERACKDLGSISISLVEREVLQEDLRIEVSKSRKD